MRGFEGVIWILFVLLQSAPRCGKRAYPEFLVLEEVWMGDITFYYLFHNLS